MKHINLTTGEYASKWSLTDFYPEAAHNLRLALISGEDFTTDFGCKKEIRYARYTRDDKCFTVHVSCVMDDLWESDDLIYDALWETCHVEEELPEDIIDSIRDAAIDMQVNDGTDLTRVLPREASFDEIVKLTEQLESEAEENNKHMYEELCECVKAYWQYLQNEPMKED